MHILSTMRSSNSMSEYSAATPRATSRNSPSDNLRMFALWTAVTFLRPSFRAYSKAKRQISELALRVMILMDSAASSPTLCSTPEYRSSVFSRTTTKSTSSNRERTPAMLVAGRRLAYRPSFFRSVNVALRKKLGLYANLRPATSMAGVRSRFEDVDLVVVRENTEDLYSGVEHNVGDDAAESIKIITRKASSLICRFAFEYARKEGRKKVTAVHEANILKLSDGLFLEVARGVAAEYSDIEFEDRIVDNMCMQLVQKPERYDVLLCPNLYGDILSDLCAGLVGGLGVAPGANIGEDVSVFEPVHGSAPKYAGQDKVNPTALILSAVLMLRHIEEKEAADALYQAVRDVIGRGETVTYDLGGTAGTSAMGEAIARRVREISG